MNGEAQPDGKAEIAFPERHIVGAKDINSLVDGAGFHARGGIHPDIGKHSYADADPFFGRRIDYLCLPGYGSKDHGHDNSSN